MSLRVGDVTKGKRQPKALPVLDEEAALFRHIGRAQRRFALPVGPNGLSLDLRHRSIGRQPMMTERRA